MKYSLIGIPSQAHPAGNTVQGIHILAHHVVSSNLFLKQIFSLLFIQNDKDVDEGIAPHTKGTRTLSITLAKYRFVD